MAADLSPDAVPCYRSAAVARSAHSWLYTALCVALAASLVGARVEAQQAPLTHTVADGETLSTIAQRFHVSTASLAERNHLTPPYVLRRGRVLRLPRAAVMPTATAPARTTASAHTPATAARTTAPASRTPPAPPPRAASTAARPGAGARVASRASSSASRREPRGRRSRWGAPSRPGVVSLHRIYSDERLTANLRRVGRSVLGVMRRFMRSTSGATHSIDPRLLRNLALVSDHFGGRTVEVISGFRPYRRGQWTPHSNHNSGRAIDFRVSGVPRRTLVDFCRTLRNVGCGFYPRSVFIHMDVRGDNAYWVDWSRPGERPRYGRDGRPPPSRSAPSVTTAVTAVTPPTAPTPAPPGADGEMNDVADDAPAIRTAAPPDDDHGDDHGDDHAAPAPAAPAAPAASSTQ